MIKKYSLYFNGELKQIYESEECKKCQIFKNKLSKLHKNLKSEQEKEKDTSDTREKISDISGKFSNHKKVHTNDFSTEDISRILKIAGY